MFEGVARRLEGVWRIFLLPSQKLEGSITGKF